jgi:LysM repeat protein/ABC-type branched-subunit amino acid transport system substrate-binding protein
LKNFVLNKICLTGILFLLCFSFFAQTKSTNIQTIDGVKYYIHKIEKGQSLYSLTKLYNVSLDEIYVVNPDVKSGTKAGQEIKIPFRSGAVNSATVASTPTTAVPGNSVTPIDTSIYYTHKIAKKETLYAIGKKYNITEAELKILNPSLISQGPKEGQVIIVGEKKKIIRPNNPITGTISTHPDSANPYVIHHEKKPNYNIALILPFKLDQSLNTDISALVKSRSSFPVVPALAVDFYLGFKMAVDSLSGQGFELNLDLYDIDDKDSAKLVHISADPRFKQTDFIFGPLYASGFKNISQKAKDNGIPIVSPITQQNKMLYNNVYVSKTNPSQFTLLECLADYCLDSLKSAGANIILVQLSNEAKEVSYLKAFKKYYNERVTTSGRPAKDTVPQVKGISGVKSAFVPGVKNVIVTLSNNQVQITDFTTQLAIFSEKKDVTLCGWQNISTNDNLDQDYLNQLHFTFPYQFNLINTSGYGGLIAKYKSLQDAYPGEYFFIGFDVAYYYLKNLKEQGSDFIYSLNRLPYEGNCMRFNFTRPDNLTGFDNRGMYIFRYNNYQVEKTGWK